MEKYIIIILCLIIIYLLCFNNNIEKAGNTSSDNLNSDLVDSIKNLGQLAKDIQKPTGLTLPGNLVVTNNIDVSGNSNFRGSLNFLPKGCIIAWSGELNAIPYGWTLCDGSNGTPNLRERFLIGSTTDIKNNTFGGNHTYNFAYKQTSIHIYIDSYVDFLPKTANLVGGDTRKERNTPNLANHAKQTKGKTPPLRKSRKR